MSSEDVTLVDALEGLQEIIDGKAGEPSKAIEEAEEDLLAAEATLSIIHDL